MNKKIIVIGILSLILLLSNQTINAIELNNTDKDDGIVDQELPELTLDCNEIIVKFNEDCLINFHYSKNNIASTGIKSVDQINQKYCIDTCEKIFNDNSQIPFSNVYKFRVSEKFDMDEILNELNSNINVEYAQPNYKYELCEVPNDTFYSKQWYLPKISAEESWDITTGGSYIKIAIIDTGVDYTHLDLFNNCLPEDGYDFINDDNDAFDDHGHGTICAGIAAGVTNNQLGIAGVSWESKIVPIKCFSNTGIGYEEDIVSAIYHCVNKGVNIISMSWGSYNPSNLIKDALDYAHEQNIILVAAAGNYDSNRLYYPACYDSVISVAATDQIDQKASFSNFGSWVDIAAPGVDIYSTRPDNSYSSYNGTSFSCPIIAGVAALVLSKYPTINPDELRTIVSNSFDNIDMLDYINGRINVKTALTTEMFTSLLDDDFNWGDVKGEIGIYGRIDGDGFKKYTLSIGDGYNPSSFSEIHESIMKNNGLLKSINTLTMDEGVYTIQLKTTYSHGSYYDRISILVNNKQNTIVIDKNGNADFSSIQEGIDNAGPGDTVYIKSGEYKERIRIYEQIILKGESPEATIIDGQNLGTVIKVKNVDGIIIKNLSSKNSFLKGSYKNSGLLLDNSDNALVENCLFSDCLSGLALSKTKKTNIKNCIFERNTAGVHIEFSEENKISDSQISEGGIWFYISNNNEIVNNTLHCNRGVDMYISANNTLYHNNFYTNPYYDFVYCEYKNFWSNDLIKEGNYWDNYNGADENNDGIGDTPHRISKYMENPDYDYYPLMQPYSNNKAPNNPTIKGNKFGKNQVEYTYKICSSDPEGDDVFYFVDWGDGNNTGWIGPYSSGQEISLTYVWDEQNSYDLKVQSKDEHGAKSDWVEIEINMETTKSKSAYVPILKFLDNRPLFNLLLQLLQK